MKQKSFLFVCMVFFIGAGYGQNVDALSAEQPPAAQAAPSPLFGILDNGTSVEHLPADQDNVDVRRFDRNVWKEIVGTTDYTQEKAIKKKQTAIDSSNATSTRTGKRVQPAEEEEPESEGFTISPFVRTLLTVMVYGAIIALIGYILFLIIKHVSSQGSPKIIKPQTPDDATRIEDIKELEIDRLLREALASGNFRLAIRIYFLGLLKKLDEDGVIVWKKDKTNRDYLAELFSKSYYFDEIKSLTLAYEQVWYGEHELSADRYQDVISSFKSIDQQLKDSKPA